VAALTTDNFFGQLLRGLFGWDPAPSIEEMAVWIAYISGIGFLYFRGMPRPQLFRSRRRRRRRRAESFAQPPGAAEASDA
jgi:hypothetical protein